MTILAQTGTFSWATQWSKYGTGTIAAVAARAKIVATATPVDGDTVTIGATTYTLKTTLTPAADEVLIGVSASTALANLAAAVNAGAGSGTLYGAGTVANVSFTAVASNWTVFLTAITAGKAGNLIALSETSSHLTTQAPTGGYSSATYDLNAQSYSRHRSEDIDYDAVEDSRIFPLEVGGVITPTGAYKAGAYVAGGATLLPRLEDTFGELLLGLMGSATVSTDTPVSGANTHVFTFDPNYVEEIPWFTVRKMIPGRYGVRPEGVIGIDNKLASMKIMVPQNDILSARVDFVGRIPQFDNYADAWLYRNDYENADKAAFSCKGSFSLPTVYTNSLPVTSVVIDIVNGVTSPQDEKVIGSYFPDDFVPRTRAMQIRFVNKWSDPDLYQRVMTNQSNGTAWDPTPFTTVYNSGNYAFEVDISSARFITGTTPYTIKIRAGTVVWQPNGPVRLQGGGILALEYIGTVIQPDTNLGVNYADIILVNARSTAYAKPTQP